MCDGFANWALSVTDKFFILAHLLSFFEGSFWRNVSVKNSISFSLESFSQNRCHQPPYSFFKDFKEKEIAFLTEWFQQKIILKIW